MYKLCSKCDDVYSRGMLRQFEVVTGHLKAMLDWRQCARNVGVCLRYVTLYQTLRLVSEFSVHANLLLVCDD